MQKKKKKNKQTNYISNSKQLLDFNTKSEPSSWEPVGASMQCYGEEPQKTQDSIRNGSCTQCC